MQGTFQTHAVFLKGMLEHPARLAGPSDILLRYQTPCMSASVQGGLFKRGLASEGWCRSLLDWLAPR